MERLKERQAAEEEAAKQKYEYVKEMQAAGKEVSFAADVTDTANAGITAAKDLLGELGR